MYSGPSMSVMTSQYIIARASGGTDVKIEL